jgi:predicted acetyltransferase
VDRAERAELDLLVDEYLAELSLHRELAVGPTDAASYTYLPLYWSEAGRHAFWIVRAGVRCGFVLVREVERESILEMSDFYVRPACRRAGLGRAVLAELWRRLPGSWRLQVHPRNEAGAAFWQRCIEAFAAGEIEMREVVADDGRRLEYRFEIAVT